MDILNLFHIHEECHRIIDRICDVFSERYSHLPPMNKGHFKRKVISIKPRPKTVVDEEGNEVNVLAYFSHHVCPHGSIRSIQKI